MAVTGEAEGSAAATRLSAVTAARARIATRALLAPLPMAAGVIRKLLACRPRRASSAASRGSETAGVKVLERSDRLDEEAEAARAGVRTSESAASAAPPIPPIIPSFLTPFDSRDAADVVRASRLDQQSTGERGESSRSVASFPQPGARGEAPGARQDRRSGLPTARACL